MKDEFERMMETKGERRRTINNLSLSCFTLGMIACTFG